MRFLYSIMFLSLFGWLGAQNSPEMGNGNIMEERSQGIDQEPAALGQDTDEALKLFIPNAFTPNEDGINDIYYISNSGFESFDFTVFDRWGNQVFLNAHFQPNDETEGWDGTFRGKVLNGGVFVWVAKVVFKDGTTEVLSGDVTVVR